MAKSVESNVEFFFKEQLKSMGIKFYNDTENMNSSIKTALENYHSKSGGSGKNYPDIQVLIKTNNQRFIPVMIEAKGRSGDMVGFVKGSTTEIDMSSNAVQKYAVNGAVHYVKALFEGNACDEAIAVGINGWKLEDGNLKTEIEAYYISKKKHQVPMKIDKFEDLSFLKSSNQSSLIRRLDELNLTDDEIEHLKQLKEIELEERIHSIHQDIYEDEKLKAVLNTNEKLFVFCGLIMAGLSIDGVYDLTASDFKGNSKDKENDGKVVIERIEAFLDERKTPEHKKNLILNILKPVFFKRELWRSDTGESYIKVLFIKIKEQIIPCLTTDLHLDFTGKIFNKLSDWIHIENDKNNDVVFTPRYLTIFMAKLAHTDMNSFVLDSAMGSAGFLVSAMDLMIKDAKNKIKDQGELEAKIHMIKESQILGIEVLNNIYILAVLNMILMGDGSSNLINANSFEVDSEFPATVFLLNPPYSATDKGLNFVCRALNRMHSGYGCVLIQENAGAGQGGESAKEILKHNTLVASIRMPADLFRGKSSPQTAIYLFKVNQPHNPNDYVSFIDMSEDGYARGARRKSSQAVNLKDVDHAKARYQEVLDIVLGRKPRTNYYTEENGTVIKDIITLNGDDWTFNHHKKIDLTPSLDDFKKTVSDYLSWKVSLLVKNKANFQ